MMGRKKERDWLSLDNAAKIFPSTSTGRSSNVFRFSCELTESVDRDILQTALEQTLERFPFFQVVLKRGFFWYYLELSDLIPIVEEERLPPCSRLYYKDRRHLLIRVTYFEKRINFEVFHALTDGTGAIAFLRMLIYQYLTMRHKDQMPESLPPLLMDASQEQKKEDSFQKYYDPKKKLRKKKIRAYSLKGTKLSEGRLSIIEGVMPAGDVLGLARENYVTLTEYLAALLLISIRTEMTIRDADKPIVLAIPVNLRKYFNSGSARNFFGLISARYDFAQGSGKLEEVAADLKRSFEGQLTAENLIRRMSRMIATERNPFARGVPLSLKDIILKFAKDSNMSEYTCTLSNVGKVDMPEIVRGYIERFDVYNSTSGLQICLCTYGDKLAVTFTSSFAGTDIQKNFFRGLSSKGIKIDLFSNIL